MGQCCSDAEAQHVQLDHGAHVIATRPHVVEEPQLPNECVRVVLDRYLMFMDEANLTGEGQFSICRKGEDVNDKRPVAIKVYKSNERSLETTKQKFEKQIEVLRELLLPLKQPDDVSLWCESLAEAESKNLFVQLINYSQDESGIPRADQMHGIMYVVTDLATHSLKDYLEASKGCGKTLSKNTVYDIARAAILVSAGLHAKGWVHLDLKPENFMFFDDRMKLIDVDGCVKIGTVVSVTDKSISFSPCYCAPEWAAFLRTSKDAEIEASPCLDVWSIGMTICETITLEPTLQHLFVGLMRNGVQYKQKLCICMDYLASTRSVSIPESIHSFDYKLYDLLVNSLLVRDTSKRVSMAQALSHSYFDVCDHLGRFQPSPIVRQLEVELEELTSTRNVRKSRVHGGRSHSQKKEVDPKGINDWIQRDTWITANGSFVYFSVKEQKRKVVFDCHQIHDAEITRLEACPKGFGFQFKFKGTGDNVASHVYAFACETEGECTQWLSRLSQVQQRPPQSQKPRADEESSQDDEPVFKTKLWQVQVKGVDDRVKGKTCSLGDIRLARNASLAHSSKREKS